jgi:signal transduction histidine kinase/CheY-like chemotaxis protein
MSSPPTGPPRSRRTGASLFRGRLFHKYVALFVGVVSAALVANALLDTWASYREQNVLLVRLQYEQAKAAATRISLFIKDIERQLAWATQLPWTAATLGEWRFDAVRLLRLVPAVTEVAQLDGAGREQGRVSRLVKDALGRQTDFSKDEFFVKALANKIYYGPVHFVGESEPYMTLAMAGVRRDWGISVAEVNLKYIWDVVSQIRVGVQGRAYVVDPEGRLIAHPEISMVLRNTDVSRLAQVKAARAESAAVAPPEQPLVTEDIEGRRVLSVHARVDPLDWLVFVELPVEEAYAPLYQSLQRSGAFVVLALVLATFAGLFLARRMIIPIRALSDGAARIGSGDLAHRIAIETGDELQALGREFNSMAARLQESHATLESKIKDRTLAKSRLLAAASHDLRQPLHALGLFVAQLRTASTQAERGQIFERVDTAIATMNELFNALLDISRLDAGALAPKVTEFPVAKLLKRVHTTFVDTAQATGLELRVISSEAWVRSDFVLLEQVLLNLVSNAVRYTERGGILVGCRRRGGQLRIEVWDTGAGIPEDQRKKIFSEFYRYRSPQGDESLGLGLGLAIVDRLCGLLGHPIELTSTVGRGSRFAVSVPIVAAARAATAPVAPPPLTLDIVPGKVIALIDDDPLALEAMAGLLRGWGCHILSGGSATEVLIKAAGLDHPPDLVISDFHLSDGKTGLEAIEQLRTTIPAPIPAFLVSADNSPALKHEARACGYHLLYKPVDPISLRAILNRILRRNTARAASHETS